MLRGGPQTSAQDNSKQQQQKQKKRLSFKDPEVEGPLRNYLYAGGRSKTLVNKTTKATNSRKTSASVEDLTLEDQALHIAHSVGSAFCDLSVADNEQDDFPALESIPTDIELQETEIRDSSPTEFVSYQKSYQIGSFKISAEDQEFLDALVPPLQDETMRGPSVEGNDQNSTKNCIPAEPSFHQEVRPSSSTQHQLQLLRYQLEQQNQQTQMAFHQVQLLQDQMDAESVARKKAQDQNNQLMQQNKELLSHMEKLFQQIEELERQILTLEQEKKYRRTIPSPENQTTSFKQSTYATNRRPSTEQAVREKPTLQNRSLYTTPRKTSVTSSKPLSSVTSTKPLATSSVTSTKPLATSSVTSTKPLATSSVTSTKALATSTKPTIQNSTLTSARKTPSIPSRPFFGQSKNKETGTKEKETLRIGDTSPPVQSGTVSPFSSNWKIKSTESNAQSNPDKSSGSGARSRTGSFSSYSSYMRRPSESDTAKSTLFSSTNSSFSSTSTTGKKYSSSTSDLYNTPSTLQGKSSSSLMIEEPSTGVKSAVSSLSISTISKLPRYQPYVGWRRASLTSETDQVSALSKDSYKSPTKTSLFNG